MREILAKIKTRGYWRVVVRPTGFEKKRVQELSALHEIIRKCSVSLRGWDFPHIDVNNPIQPGLDWVEQATDWMHHVELWRLYQSGQFVFYGCLWEDWCDHSVWGPAPANWTPGETLSVVSAVYTYTEVCEFGSRLALSTAGADEMMIDVTLTGLNGRTLCERSDQRLDLLSSKVASIAEFPIAQTMSRDKLVARPRELAVDLSRELFARFGWDAAREVLRCLQKGLKM